MIEIVDVLFHMTRSSKRLANDITVDKELAVPHSNELSAYEKVRLENIRRNEEYLQSIGLQVVIFLYFLEI